MNMVFVLLQLANINKKQNGQAYAWPSINNCCHAMAAAVLAINTGWNAPKPYSLLITHKASQATTLTCLHSTACTM